MQFLKSPLVKTVLTVLITVIVFYKFVLPNLPDKVRNFLA